MIPLLAFSLSYILIDVALGLTSLVVGFVAALVYARHAHGSRTASEPSDERRQLVQANDNERTAMAAQQLRSLAHEMASDVGAHCQVMDGISSELGALKLNEGDGLAVNSAVARILSANSQLRFRLDEAERKIAAQAEEIRTQQFEARTDVLTGLANRRAFDDEVRRLMKAFATQGRVFSLLILDVDHFKKFNDTHGHQAGDEVLRAVGLTLRSVVKSGDLACRYGGEEFAVVMVDTNAKQARVAADRVRRAIEVMSVDFEGRRLSVTASIGVAQIAPLQDAAQLIRRADDAVYASKKAGRNAGHWHAGPECLPLDQDARPVEIPVTQPVDKKPILATPVGDFGDRFRKLPDHRVMADELGRRISESLRFGVPLALTRMEVVDFDSLESSYGEAVGDLILDSVVAFIRSNLRDMDLLARMGRGQFAIMLPGSGTDEAANVIRRVATVLASAPVPIGGKQLVLKLKSGIANAKAGDDAASLLDRAALAMDSKTLVPAGV